MAFQHVSPNLLFKQIGELFFHKNQLNNTAIDFEVIVKGDLMCQDGGAAFVVSDPNRIRQVTVLLVTLVLKVVPFL